ncbi:hypothetical protein [Halegenticoccus tardaugens]|uniref:hypothetical protein n=1 Tax=Halegenticoccus tardaugens TaxID=2071624 RepID=UPI0013E94C40|nr:hypothetical protein [Halegenticoccus tardaugens]
MCKYNPECRREPGYVVINGPDEAVLECCGVVVPAAAMNQPSSGAAGASRG